jgi:hypothetical protein
MSSQALLEARQQTMPGAEGPALGADGTLAVTGTGTALRAYQ